MKSKFVFVFIFLFAISFVSASFSLGTSASNVTSSYFSGNFVKGWVNVSFSGENLNSTITTSNGQNFSLMDLLIANNLYKECDFANCDTDYSTSGGVSSKTVSLTSGQEKLIGFKISQNILSLNTLNLKISSDVPQSCYDQLKIDVLDDDSLDIENEKSIQDVCSLSKTKGCFDETHSGISEVVLSSTRICQKVRLLESNGFRVGADINSTATDKKSVDFGLYSSQGVPLGSCANNSVLSSGEYSCDIDGINSNETRDYYVCATGNSGDASLKVNSYRDDTNGCGFAGNNFIEKGNYSYELFAYTKQFDAFGEFDMQDDYSGNFLIEVQNYLVSKYGSNLECSIKNCVVPFRIFSKANQQVTFDSLAGIATTEQGSKSISDKFYDLSEIPLKYNSGFAKLYLDNLSIYSDNGDFWIKLNGQNLFSGVFFVQEFNSINSLIPLITAATVPTEFRANVNIVQNVTSYKWDFGDGQVQSTNVNSVTYAYGNTGTFNLTLTILSGNASISKSFNITVDTPVKILGINLQTKLSALERIKSQLESLPTFYQNAINIVLDLTNVENQLTKIKIDFDSATSVADSFYIKLIGELNGVSIPNSILVSKSADMLPFYFTEDKIDIGALALLGGNYSKTKEQEYKDAILSWNLANMINTITYKEISADYGEGLDVLVNVFEINLNKKSGLENTPFLIIKKMENLNFDKDYGKREIGDYVFIPLNDDVSKIVFSTTEDISFSDLPLFISPQIGDLNVLDVSSSGENSTLKWIFFGLIIFFLILIAVAVYIALQKWYAKKYENYLFKNKNDLYNLISFVENSKNKGMEENKIVASLKKSGWSSEQVNYIIRRYLGKRTGLPELSLQKIFRKENKNIVSQRNPKQGYGFQRNSLRKF